VTTRDGLPAAGSLALKKFRVRRCTQKLYLPNGVTFTCQLEKHEPETQHKEEGVVTMPNGTARRYTIHWTDLGFTELRQTKPRGKLRQHGNHTHTL
jgi:hypothetical protein